MDYFLNNLLTPFNYHQWKEDTKIIFHSKGLYRVIMGTKPGPNAAIEKSKYMNKLDETYVFLCISISNDLLFHVHGLRLPKKCGKNFPRYSTRKMK